MCLSPYCTRNYCNSTSAKSATELPEGNFPPEIQELVHFYSNLFQEPTKLPPVRSQDHHIPLIPSVGPVMSDHTDTPLNRKLRLSSR